MSKGKMKGGSHEAVGGTNQSTVKQTVKSILKYGKEYADKGGKCESKGKR